MNKTLRILMAAAIAFPTLLAADDGGGLPFSIPVPRPKNAIQERHTNFFMPSTSSVLRSGAPSGVNSPIQRSMFASTPPPCPGPK